MRSRYSAYVSANTDWLRKSWHPDTCPETLDLEPDTRWLGLKIVHTHGGGPQDLEGEVAFVARFRIHGRGQRLEERSFFSRVGGLWVYVSGQPLK